MKWTISNMALDINKSSYQTMPRSIPNQRKKPKDGTLKLKESTSQKLGQEECMKVGNLQAQELPQTPILEIDSWIPSFKRIVIRKLLRRDI